MCVAVGRRHVRAIRAVLLVVAAGLLAVGPIPAHAEAPVTDLLVAPEGTELVTHDEGHDPAHGDFVHHQEGLEVTVVDAARGAIRVGGDLAVVVTVVRLASEQQAAEALAALGRPISAEELRSAGEQTTTSAVEDTFVEALPAPRPGAVGRRYVGGMSLVEFSQATGRDLVVFAELGSSGPQPRPTMYAALDAHRRAFPRVTMPADASARPSWRVVAAAAAAVFAAVGGLLATVRAKRRRGRRRPALSALPESPGDGPPRARLNW